jgi:hypothetical protein
MWIPTPLRLEANLRRASERDAQQLQPLALTREGYVLVRCEAAVFKPEA